MGKQGSFIYMKDESRFPRHLTSITIPAAVTSIGHAVGVQIETVVEPGTYIAVVWCVVYVRGDGGIAATHPNGPEPNRRTETKEKKRKKERKTC